MNDIRDLKAKSKLPVKAAGGNVVSAFFEENKNSIAAVLPKHISADRMLKIALGSLRAVPQLRECTSASLFGAVIQCAQLGLEPNTVMGHAYLVPFRNKRESRTDVQMFIGYRGMIDLARRSGQIVSIAAHEVCAHDEFEFAYGLEEVLRHVPAQGDRGDITHFYAVAHLKNCGHAFEVMARSDVDAIMKSTQSRGDWGPWATHYGEMGRKTAVRKLFKYLPVSVEIATAAALDVAAEMQLPQNLESVLIDGEWTQEPEAREYPKAEPEPEPESEFQDEQPEESEPEPAMVWTDASGQVFDPEKHGWNAKGNEPSYTSSRMFRKRRRISASEASAKTEPADDIPWAEIDKDGDEIP